MSIGFEGGGFAGSGFAPDDTPPVAVGPIILELELADWLAARLGVPVLPDHLPEEEDTFPLICFSAADGDSTYCLAGPSGLGWRLIQFDCWGETQPDAVTLQSRLFGVLAGYRGPAGAATINSVIAGRHLTGYEKIVSASDAGRWRAMREYRIWWGEPKPS